MLAALLSVSILGFSPAHAVGETYSLAVSPTRLQETNNARGVLLTLNVSNSNTLSSYSFTWSVKDPTGTVRTVGNSTNTPHAASFIEITPYPGKFGSSTPTLGFVGTYLAWVNQTSPPVLGSTGVASGQFQVGLTDGLSYQRTLPVSIKGVIYLPNANVTIRISGLSGMVTGFPLNRTADNTGSLSYTWTSAASQSVGSYTVTLSGTPVKSPPDTQIFTITAANVTIYSLIISKNVLQTSITEDFRFTAVYPSLAQVRTGSANLRLVEVDGVTSHLVPMTYSTALGMFHGTFQIPLTSEVGPWVATIDVNSFDDGYGNKGPASSVLKAFTVLPAVLVVSATTQYNNYTIGSIVAIYASIITPSGENFTSGTVIATTYHGSTMVGSPLGLFYDQSRGKWVGSYVVNSTNPAGIWQIQVNASDTYGNMGEGSTSTLVSVPAGPPQQNSTFTYLIVAGVILLVGLAALLAWLFLGRKRVLRRVLKVDIEAVHSEAAKVENQEFFRKVKQQLDDQRKGTSPSQ